MLNKEIKQKTKEIFAKKKKKKSLTNIFNKFFFSSINIAINNGNHSVVIGAAVNNIHWVTFFLLFFKLLQMFKDKYLLC